MDYFVYMKIYEQTVKMQCDVCILKGCCGNPEEGIINVLREISIGETKVEHLNRSEGMNRSLCVKGED